jgi:hypothetical protein
MKRRRSLAVAAREDHHHHQYERQPQTVCVFSPVNLHVYIVSISLALGRVVTQILPVSRLPSSLMMVRYPSVPTRLDDLY